jgi:hypothetical protein
VRLPPGIELHIDPQTGRITLTITPVGGGPTAEGGPVSFGLPGFAGASSVVEGVRETIASALAAAATRLGAALTEIVAEVSTLEVATYVSDDMDAVTYDSASHSFSAPAHRKVVTRLRLDGNALQLLPIDADAVDDRLWTRHVELFHTAQAHRAELVKALSEAVARLMGAVNP